MESVRRAELALLIVLAVLLVAPVQGAGRTIYCCDVSGQPVCGDILPAACYGRAYRELSPAGTVRRLVPAPLTAEEIARRDEAIRQSKAAEAIALKQRRLDQALLDTYPSAEEIESRRDRAVSELDRTIGDLRLHEVQLVARKQVLTQDAAAYSPESLPADLADNIRTLDGELAAQRSIIDAKQRERDAIKVRFDEDLRRYRELTGPALRPR